MPAHRLPAGVSLDACSAHKRGYHSGNHLTDAEIFDEDTTLLNYQLLSDGTRRSTLLLLYAVIPRKFACAQYTQDAWGA